MLHCFCVLASKFDSIRFDLKCGCPGRVAPVTRDVAAAKTDAAVWASRIVNILDNLSYAEQLAGQLKEDLRTDEMTRQSYDNFYSHCLGIHA